MASRKAPATSTAKRATNPLALATAVSERVQIESVRLVGCECRQTPRVHTQQLEFRLKHEASTTVDKRTGAIGVLARFTMRAHPKGEGSGTVETAIQLDAAFLLTYSAADLEGLNAANFRSFGQCNGIYNAWPYWREFVQSTVARMGLPTLTIPVFRFAVPKRATGASKKTAAAKSRKKRLKAPTRK